ncbi:MAG: hypothetical protein ACK4WH_16000, partial [Phycisphaerales bacterium]
EAEVDSSQAGSHTLSLGYEEPQADGSVKRGSVQAAVGAMMLREQRLPARVHAGRCPADLQAGPSAGGPARLGHVLVCTGSQAGQSAAVVLKRAG